MDNPSGDPAVKQILVWMDGRAAVQFIIQDLDDTHVVIKQDAVGRVMMDLEVEASPDSTIFHTQANTAAC